MAPNVPIVKHRRWHIAIGKSVQRCSRFEKKIVRVEQS